MSLAGGCDAWQCFSSFLMIGHKINPNELDLKLKPCYTSTKKLMNAMRNWGDLHVAADFFKESFY